MLDIFTRKNFSEKIKLKIIKKASRCQMCNLQTECGECAHIVASGKDGPRNKHQLVQEHIISENYEINADDNGLYLCANCHTLIDRYPEKYTYEYLVGLKSNTGNGNDKPNINICESIVIDNNKPDTNDVDNDSVDKNVYLCELYRCSYCGNNFTNKNNMYRHRKHRCPNRPNSQQPVQLTKIKLQPKIIETDSVQQLHEKFVESEQKAKDRDQQVINKDQMLIEKIAKLEDAIQTLSKSQGQQANIIINNNVTVFLDQRSLDIYEKKKLIHGSKSALEYLHNTIKNATSKLK